MDYKLKLLQILDCFSTMEGTLYELDWEIFGITKDEKEEILKMFREYTNNN